MTFMDDPEIFYLKPHTHANIKRGTLTIVPWSSPLFCGCALKLLAGVNLREVGMGAFCSKCSSALNPQGECLCACPKTFQPLCPKT